MKTTDGKNFSAAEIGALREWGQHSLQHPKAGEVRGKRFLRKMLGLTSMEVSLGVMSPGAGLPFLHRHREHEELYLFVGGKGQFQVDGEVLEVREGTAIRVAPDGARGWRNHSTEPLYYICVQAAAGTVRGEATSDGVGVEGPVVWR